MSIGSVLLGVGYVTHPTLDVILASEITGISVKTKYNDAHPKCRVSVFLRKKRRVGQISKHKTQGNGTKNLPCVRRVSKMKVKFNPAYAG